MRINTATGTGAGTEPVKDASDLDSQQRSFSLQEFRQSIADDLFGKREEREQKEEEQVSLEDIPLSEKDLPLKLVGTILRENPKESIAVIEDTHTGKQEMYQVGDRIDEIQIESVLRSNVVIKSSDGKKVLTMQYEELREPGRHREATGAASESRDSGETRDLSKEYVLKSLKDMSGLMQSALIKPYLRNGETVGFQLDNIRQGSFYDRIGLQDKDVITHVNGKELKNPQQLMGFSQNLKRMDQVRMTLRRNGEKREVRYRLR